ncbi:hypothetical protein OOT55_14280 [Marinimicrobium sp. C6131]|uniref:hypothetical protein n=1 Tax=Marinimicrobium sp. C6131 TaxID=3022676 RepID=UPI00223D7D0B|nr:hypothetical protein [Marinimicrobium sp. C6131]UZJ43815.1 hypothetical protein OOT55_14280 [Marinimicrobium sp. C6131]
MKVFASVLLLLASVNVLANKTYTCTFDSFSDNEGKHDSDLSLTYLLDEDAEKFYVIGNNGRGEVIHIFRGDARSFIEVTGTGNVMVTTITPELRAVHSRNSVMFGELIPSQYYGKCVVE